MNLLEENLLRLMSLLLKDSLIQIVDRWHQLLCFIKIYYG